MPDPSPSSAANTLRVALAQFDSSVGDIPGNTERVIAQIARARDELNADVIVFPELVLTGYPPADLLLHNGFRVKIDEAIERVRKASDGIGVVVGYPYYATPENIYNAASFFYNSGTLTTYFKQHLPNYGVFDEKRYFLPGSEGVIVRFKGLPIALTICEDVWFSYPVKQAADLGILQQIITAAGHGQLAGDQNVADISKFQAFFSILLHHDNGFAFVVLQVV